MTTGDINPARLFVRQGGRTAIFSSDVTHTVTIELSGSTSRQRQPVASALLWHMKRNDLIDYLATEDSWQVEHVTRRDDQRETHMHFRCSTLGRASAWGTFASVEAVRKLAADAIKDVLVGCPK